MARRGETSTSPELPKSPRSGTAVASDSIANGLPPNSNRHHQEALSRGNGLYGRNVFFPGGLAPTFFLSASPLNGRARFCHPKGVWENRIADSRRFGQYSAVQPMLNTISGMEANATPEPSEKKKTPEVTEDEFDLSLLEDSLAMTPWERMQANDDAVNFADTLRTAMQQRDAKSR
jgi:hypothetical protein